MTLWPIRDRTGVITGVCSTMRDMTERKRAEQQLTALHAQQQHAALALHLMGASEQIPSARAATRYLPSTQGQGVGGDWLDLIDLGAGRVGVIIGDVMGRGFEAAVVMGQLRSAARALALAGLCPYELMRTLDAFTCGLPEQFVTCTYLEAAPARGEMTVCSAGHLPTFLIGPGASVEALPVPTGIPLGVGGVPHEQTRLPLRAGTTLALCTDGLVETPHHHLDVRLEHLATALGEVFTDTQHLEMAADRTLQALLPDTTDYAEDVSLLLVSFPTAPLAAVTAQLRGEAASVPTGRRFLAEHLHRWHLAPLADTALLLASELMTNALRHAPGPLAVELWYSARELGVEVTGRSTPRPCARLADVNEESGRGLLLVEALADAWGTRPTADGKTVWFTLLLPRTRKQRPQKPRPVSHPTRHRRRPPRLFLPTRSEGQKAASQSTSGTPSRCRRSRTSPLPPAVPGLRTGSPDSPSPERPRALQRPPPSAVMRPLDAVARFSRREQHLPVLSGNLWRSQGGECR